MTPSLTARLERLEAIMPQEIADTDAGDLSENLARFGAEALAQGWLEEAEPGRYEITDAGKEQSGRERSLLEFWAAWPMLC